MNTLKKIIEDNYKIFENFDAKTKKEMIDTCKYIEFLASQSGTRIDDWDIIKIFKAPKAQKKLVIDKGEINKKFFKYKEKSIEKSLQETSKKKEEAKNEEPKELKETSIEDDLNRLMNKRENIQIRLKQTVERWVSQLKEKQQNAKRVTKDYYDRYVKEMSKLIEHERTLQVALQNDDTERMFNEFKETSALGFWKFYRLYRNKITFSTAYDVVISHKNPAANLDMQVNMGQYLCTIDLNTFEILVKPFRNNLDSSGYYHPYMSTDGVPCWGTSSETAQNLIANRKIAELMNLLASLLCTYDDSNPHRPLVRFHEIDKPENRVTTVTLEEEIRRKEENDGIRPITITENVTQEDLQMIMEQDPSGDQLFTAICNSLESITNS